MTTVVTTVVYLTRSKLRDNGLSIGLQFESTQSVMTGKAQQQDLETNGPICILTQEAKNG